MKLDLSIWEVLTMSTRAAASPRLIWRGRENIGRTSGSHCTSDADLHAGYRVRKRRVPCQIISKNLSEKGKSLKPYSLYSPISELAIEQEAAIESGRSQAVFSLNWTVTFRKYVRLHKWRRSHGANALAQAQSWQPRAGKVVRRHTKIGTTDYGASDQDG